MSNAQPRIISSPGKGIPLKLYLKLADGVTTIELDCHVNDLISEVKSQIIAKVPTVSFDSLSLGFAGKELYDDRTLCDYDIQKESTLMLFNRLRSG